MIPFEELSQALARWRTRNGLASGPSPRREPAAAFVPANTDEMMAEQPTAVAPNPLADVSPVRESTNEFDLDSLFVDEDR